MSCTAHLQRKEVVCQFEETETANPNVYIPRVCEGQVRALFRGPQATCAGIKQTDHLAVSFSNSRMAEDEDGAYLEDPSCLAQSWEKFASILPYGRVRFFPLCESEMYRIVWKMEGSYAPG